MVFAESVACPGTGTWLELAVASASERGFDFDMAFVLRSKS